MTSMFELPPTAKDEKFKLTEAFLRAVRCWEELPHNQQGQDKTWVERLIAETRDHYRRAVRIR